MFLKQNNSNVVTDEIFPGIYSIEDNSETVYTMGGHEGTLQIEYDDVSMKAKLILTRFESNFGTLRIDEKSFFNIFFIFTAFWDCKPTTSIYADPPVVYTSDKIIISIKIEKTPLKCNVICGVVVKRKTRAHISISIISDKPPGFDFFCGPETIHFKKIYLLWIQLHFVKKVIITKKSIFTEKQWLLHYNLLKFEVLNEISRI